MVDKSIGLLVKSALDRLHSAKSLTDLEMLYDSHLDELESLYSNRHSENGASYLHIFI